MISIQLGHPKINSIDTVPFNTVQDVFIKLFYHQEESIFLYWFETPIQFRYQQDLSQSFDDILAMTWLIQKDAEGKTKIKLSNQIIETHLELYWTQSEVVIQVEFIAHEGLYNNYAQALNQNNSIKMSRTAFLREWKMILHQIMKAFETANITIKDGTERRKWELLKKVTSNISGYGRLYTK